MAARIASNIDATPEDRKAILDIISHYGTKALRLAWRTGTHIVVLQPGERYADRSPVLRRLASGVDHWPVPPAGLFVVEERTVYARTVSAMTIAHEFGHALDCALGGGVYLSGIDPRIRRAFSDARRFVTPYSAVGLDEYLAEAFRAYVEVNDERSPWPPATRSRLAQVDPAMFDIIAMLLPDARATTSDLTHVGGEEDTGASTSAQIERWALDGVTKVAAA